MAYVFYEPNLMFEFECVRVILRTHAYVNVELFYSLRLLWCGVLLLF